MKREVIWEDGETGRKTVGYVFGKGEPSVCVLGAVSGSEAQALFIAARLVKKLKELEARGAMVSNHQVLVIPDASGAANGAGRERLEAYPCAVGFSGFSRNGDFVPHVRVRENGEASGSLANLFGMPYVLLTGTAGEEPRTAGRDGKDRMFWLCAGGRLQIEEEPARQAVSAVLRFLTRMGILRYASHSGYIASMVRETDLTVVRTDASGIFRPLVRPGQEVRRGDTLAEILDPLEGETISRIQSPTDGVMFFVWGRPLAEEGDRIGAVIRRLHQ